MSESKQQLMDIRAVARILGCCTATVRRMADRDELPQPVRVGRRLLRWDRGVIQAWIENGCGGYGRRVVGSKGKDDA